MFVLVGSVYVADLTVPHTFSPGTPAKSSEVNENKAPIFLSGVVYAAEFVVSNTTQLHTALESAAMNGEDDIIIMERGTYPANHGTFYFNDNESHNHCNQFHHFKK